MWMALLSDSSWLNGSGTWTGQYSAQVVQPVQMSSLTYRGFRVSVTVKSPASPFHGVDFRVGQDLDVGMPIALDELRGFDAHRAVVGGKGLVQLGHLAADGHFSTR